VETLAAITGNDEAAKSRARYQELDKASRAEPYLYGLAADGEAGVDRALGFLLE
jgi:hypothetical protein